MVSLSLPSPYPTRACTFHLLVGHNELLMTFLTRRTVASWSESTFTPATAKKEGNIFTKDSPVHNLRYGNWNSCYAVEIILRKMDGCFQNTFFSSYISHLYLLFWLPSTSLSNVNIVFREEKKNPLLHWEVF